MAIASIVKLLMLSTCSFFLEGLYVSISLYMSIVNFALAYLLEDFNCIVASTTTQKPSDNLLELCGEIFKLASIKK